MGGGVSVCDGGGVGGRSSGGGYGGDGFDLLRVVTIKLGKEQDRVIH